MLQSSYNQGTDFIVDAGALSFSVMLYTICAILAVALLMARRFLPVFGNAELGGTTVPKVTNHQDIDKNILSDVLLCYSPWFSVVSIIHVSRLRSALSHTYYSKTSIKLIEQNKWRFHGDIYNNIHPK